MENSRRKDAAPPIPLADDLHRLQLELGRPLYMPYLTLGDPTFASSVQIAGAMMRGGADILELGIPFSDPTADGPVIQKAMVRSMSTADFSLDAVFATTEQIHSINPSVPLVFLTYLNPVLSSRSLAHPSVDASGNDSSVTRNASAFLERASRAGIRGLVIPDLPVDSLEARELRSLGEDWGIAIVGMIAPNTSDKRMAAVCRHAGGFVYYVTSHGVTGERSTLPTDLTERLAHVRRLSPVPVFAGFGISRPEQARMLVGHADGVIVGTAHHRIIEEDPTGAAARIEDLTRKFVESLRAK